MSGVPVYARAHRRILGCVYGPTACNALLQTLMRHTCTTCGCAIGQAADISFAAERLPLSLQGMAEALKLDVWTTLCQRKWLCMCQTATRLVRFSSRNAAATLAAFEVPPATFTEHERLEQTPLCDQVQRETIGDDYYDLEMVGQPGIRCRSPLALGSIVGLVDGCLMSEEELKDIPEDDEHPSSAWDLADFARFGVEQTNRSEFVIAGLLYGKEVGNDCVHINDFRVYFAPTSRKEHATNDKYQQLRNICFIECFMHGLPFIVAVASRPIEPAQWLLCGPADVVEPLSSLPAASSSDAHMTPPHQKGGRGRMTSKQATDSYAWDEKTQSRQRLPDAAPSSVKRRAKRKAESPVELPHSSVDSGAASSQQTTLKARAVASLSPSGRSPKRVPTQTDADGSETALTDPDQKQIVATIFQRPSAPRVPLSIMERRPACTVLCCFQDTLLSWCFLIQECCAVGSSQTAQPDSAIAPTIKPDQIGPLPCYDPLALTLGLPPLLKQYRSIITPDFHVEQTEEIHLRFAREDEVDRSALTEYWRSNIFHLHFRSDDIFICRVCELRFLRGSWLALVELSEKIQTRTGPWLRRHTMLLSLFETLVRLMRQFAPLPCVSSAPLILTSAALASLEQGSNGYSTRHAKQKAVGASSDAEQFPAEEQSAKEKACAAIVEALPAVNERLQRHLVQCVDDLMPTGSTSFTAQLNSKHSTGLRKQMTTAVHVWAEMTVAARCRQIFRVPPESWGWTSTFPLHCLCHLPEYAVNSNMVACSRCSVWFHLACIGLHDDSKVVTQDLDYVCIRCRSGLGRPSERFRFKPRFSAVEPSSPAQAKSEAKRSPTQPNETKKEPAVKRQLTSASAAVPPPSRPPPPPPRPPPPPPPPAALGFSESNSQPATKDRKAKDKDKEKHKKNKKKRKKR